MPETFNGRVDVRGCKVIRPTTLDRMSVTLTDEAMSC